MRLFEPRYVELANRVFPPEGQGKFGYSEAYPPKVGAAGVLAQIEQFKWASQADQKVALLAARAARRFRILSVRSEEIVPSKPPLFVAHVQLLADRDVARGPGAEGFQYWSRPQPDASAEDAPKKRADAVTAGTALVARLGAPVFETPESWHAVSTVPAGMVVYAAGPPRVVEGYLMVPIVPSGAVELTLFRDLAPDGGESPVPTEQELRATLLNWGKAPPPPGADIGDNGHGADAGRKSSRRRG